MTPLVVKIGGSCFREARFVPWLTAFLSTLRPPVLLVPGGGSAADVVRDWDALHQLGEDRSHWLALRSLTLTAHFLAALVPESAIVTGWTECTALWERNGWPILDAFAFAQADQAQLGALPPTWAVTSDSLAARVAECGSARLLLVKSAVRPAGSWADLAQCGYVDRYFPTIQHRASLAVAVVDASAASEQPV